jgi:hypothetical protein
VASAFHVMNHRGFRGKNSSKKDDDFLFFFQLMRYIISRKTAVDWVARVGGECVVSARSLLCHGVRRAATNCVY